MPKLTTVAFHAQLVISPPGLRPRSSRLLQTIHHLKSLLPRWMAVTLMLFGAVACYGNGENPGPGEDEKADLWGTPIGGSCAFDQNCADGTEAYPELVTARVEFPKSIYRCQPADAEVALGALRDSLPPQVSCM